MSDINDGGPAFPIPGMSNLPNGEFLYPHAGMTLRDYFAAKAMQGWIASGPNVNGRALSSADEEGLRLLASVAYQVADAMLNARNAPYIPGEKP